MQSLRGVVFSPQVERIAVFYWKVKSKDYSVEHGFPSFSFDLGLRLPDGGRPVNVYGIPEMEYPNHIKAGATA